MSAFDEAIAWSSVHTVGHKMWPKWIAWAQPVVQCFLSDSDHTNPLHGWTVRVEQGPILYSSGVWRDMVAHAKAERLYNLREVGGWGDDGVWVPSNAMSLTHRALPSGCACAPRRHDVNEVQSKTALALHNLGACIPHTCSYCETRAKIDRPWVTCKHCGAEQSPHENWPTCTYCGKTN